MKFTISVISHGQGNMVQNLLSDLRRLSLFNVEVILTLNIPEDESWLDKWMDLSIKIIRNNKSYGFGKNHNQAFLHSTGDIFCIVNPDIRLINANFLDINDIFVDERVASVAPLILGPEGDVQDSARFFPTFPRIVKRIILRQRNIDYPYDKLIDVDWTAGMFIIFRQKAFSDIGGFNEKYFMYLEDADICRRLQRSGWKILFQPSYVVVHDARRASHRNLQHFQWHARSMIRFLMGF